MYHHSPGLRSSGNSSLAQSVPSSPRSPTTWSADDVSRWLTDIRLPQYCASFREQGVDGHALLRLLTPQSTNSGSTGGGRSAGGRAGSDSGYSTADSERASEQSLARMGIKVRIHRRKLVREIGRLIRTADTLPDGRARPRNRKQRQQERRRQLLLEQQRQQQQQQQRKREQQK